MVLCTMIIRRLSSSLQAFHPANAYMEAFLSRVQNCIKLESIAMGKHVHACIMKSTQKSNRFILSTLVGMYAKCRTVVDARQVFDRLSGRNLVTWTMMINTYVKLGHPNEALVLFQQMEEEGVNPDKVAFVLALNACSSLQNLESGKKIHDQILRAGCKSDLYLENSLVDMYAKCGSIEDSQNIFDNMSERNVVSWNVLIAGYVAHGRGQEALLLYDKLQHTGIKPDKVTFLAVLNACSNATSLRHGQMVHLEIVKSGFHSDVFISNTLIDMYGKCRNIEKARWVFDEVFLKDLVSWNVMIAGYVTNEITMEALNLFKKLQLQGYTPNEVTFVNALNACAVDAIFEHGKLLHSEILKIRCRTNIFVNNTLVDMYAKCGSMADAQQVFDRMFMQDTVSWNAIITGYVQYGEGIRALRVFNHMQRCNVKPDTATLLNVLSACANLAALEQGKQIHEYVKRNEYDKHPFVGNALIDVYAKCGDIENAHCFFNRLVNRDVISWNAILSGHAQQGNAKEVLSLLEQMGKEGVRSNDITYICILSACGHGGLGNEGCHYFELISQDRNITLLTRHYACMVDLLSRSGWVHEVADFVENMPFLPTVGIWMAFLSTSSFHGSEHHAWDALKHILRLEPHNAAAFMLLLNMYMTAKTAEM